ncbi:MAG: type I secretion system permease/ATPase [Alphaproteobacteria bacterium]|nr:type I secretion system permease/ATPase [Alphaproteobacteria bacterium]
MSNAVRAVTSPDDTGEADLDALAPGAPIGSLEVPDGPPEAHDGFRAALLYLAKHHGLAASPGSLTAGLPLPESGLLTPALFLRAAERIGFDATIQARSLDRIPALALPVVLMLRDGSVCIFRARRRGEAVILFPEMGEGEITLPVAQLARRYSGHLIYVKPIATHVDARDGGATRRPQDWFRNVFKLMAGEYTLTILSAAMVNLLALAIPLFTMNVYDRVLPNNATPTLWVLAIGVAIVLFFDFLLRSLRGLFVDIAGRRVDLILSSEMFEHLVDLQLAERPRTAGELANRLKDFEIVREFFTSSTIATLTDLAFMLVFIAVLFWVGGLLAFVPLAAIVLVVAIGVAVQPALKRNLERADREASLKHAHLVETISALEAVKSLNAQGQLQRGWDRIVSAAARTSRDTRQISLFALNATSFIQQCVTVAILIWGTYLFAAREISMGAIIASVMLSARCVAPLGGLAGMLVRLQQALVAFKGLDQFMQLKRETPEAKTPLHQQVGHGAIELRDVTFAYPGARTPALDGLALTIKAGERVAILGRVGSGKTTLGRLLLGLYPVSGGTVLIDGVDLRQYHPADLRRGVGLLMQDVTLFSGTVRENICFGTPWASDEQVLRAARLAGADRFIAEHPQGYDLPVGERGQFLSGGQRQAIALARALFHDPPILFLDEPTAAMDPRFEREFIERMKLVLDAGPRTLIVSTHRRSLLDLVDRVIILERGTVAADGPKDEILARLQGL